MLTVVRVRSDFLLLSSICEKLVEVNVSVHMETRHWWPTKCPLWWTALCQGAWRGEQCVDWTSVPLTSHWALLRGTLCRTCVMPLSAEVARTVLGTSSVRNVSPPVIIILVSGGVAFRVDLSSNPRNLDQRIRVNLVPLIMFAEASGSFQVSRRTCVAVLHVVKAADARGALNHLAAALPSVAHELFM